LTQTASGKLPRFPFYVCPLSERSHEIVTIPSTPYMK
jgi:hypothetical protein